MLDSHFYCTSITPSKEVLELLYNEASIDKNYYLSPARPPVLRCDVSLEIRKYFSNFFNIEFSDCGFLKSIPKFIYPTHTDSFRITALNMPMFDDNNLFESYVIDMSNPIIKKPIYYKKDYFTILNVMKYHGVINHSQAESRIMLSIGIKNISYDKILDMYKKNQLLNVI